MSIANIFNTGYTGLGAARAEMSTTGHNIANAGTEGFSRQRAIVSNVETGDKGARDVSAIGRGVTVLRVERVNDQYLEKQIQDAQRELSHHEEKEMSLRQIEDIFNELNGEGVNRMLTRFFNDVRKLSDEPESRAMREALRESTHSMNNSFHLIRSQLVDVQKHVDARIEGYVREVNTLAGQIGELNQRIRMAEAARGNPNDLLDKRDLALKKLASLINISTQKDNHGNVAIDIRGGGSLLTEDTVRPLFVMRSPADGQGKREGLLDIRSEGSVAGSITHSIGGGKIGALLELRDKTANQLLDRLDDMAYGLTNAVNELHSQGVTTTGATGIPFFKPLESREKAAEYIELSSDVLASVNNIVTAFEPNSPGDNRILLSISKLQNSKLLGDGTSTLDEWYNSIISDVGVIGSKNKFSLTQQKDIVDHLNKMRDQISGVSIDEESANLMQFQHAFEASAKVIQVADEVLKSVLELKR